MFDRQCLIRRLRERSSYAVGQLVFYSNFCPSSGVLQASVVRTFQAECPGKFVYRAHCITVSAYVEYIVKECYW